MVWLTAALGLVILLLAGDLLVRGAVNASLRGERDKCECALFDAATGG